MPRGIPQIEISYDLDANGILNVSAAEKSSGKSNKITITNDKGRLSKAQVERMVEEAEKFAEEDKAKVETIEARNELETYLYNARNSLREEKAKTVLGEDAKKGEDIAQKYLTWLESHGDETTQVYKDEMKKAEEEIKPIMMKMYAATTDKMPDMPDSEGNMPGMHGQESGPKVEEVD